MTNAQKHTIECADAWMRDKGLPTYTELAAALDSITGDLAEAIPYLKETGWQTHNEEAVVSKCAAMIAKLQEAK